MSRISSRLREIVRERAQGKCEYCLLPEGLSVHGHHVDHIQSQKHDGTDELNNLAWCCFYCNLNKGSDIASYDRETQQLTPFFNPRKQQWLEHFTLEGPDIVGITPIGRVTVRILQVNQPQQVEMRQLLMDAGKW